MREMQRNGRKESNTMLVVLAIVAAVLAAFNAISALSEVASLARLTGYQVLTNTAHGNVTLSIPENIQVEFDPLLINWSNGSIFNGELNATLMTSSNLSLQVRRGTWVNGTGQGRDTGLVLWNRGNANVRVNLSAGMNGTIMFDREFAEYRWNVSNYLPGSCSGPYADFDEFKEVSITGDMVCTDMSYVTGSNAIRIDVFLSIPQNVPRREYTDTITAIAESASAG